MNENDHAVKALHAWLARQPVIRPDLRAHLQDAFMAGYDSARSRRDAELAALRAACRSALPALQQAAREGGGTGYYQRAVDDLLAALATTPEATGEPA